MTDSDDLLMYRIADLQNWDWVTEPAFRSVVGRHVYISLEKDYYANKLGFKSGNFIKQIILNSGFTDRAVRLKLVELEKCNLVFRRPSEADGRGKSIVLTEKFIKLVESHKSHCKKILQDNFIFINQ